MPAYKNMRPLTVRLGYAGGDDTSHKWSVRHTIHTGGNRDAHAVFLYLDHFRSREKGL